MEASQVEAQPEEQAAPPTEPSESAPDTGESTPEADQPSASTPSEGADTSTDSGSEPVDVSPESPAESSDAPTADTPAESHSEGLVHQVEHKVEEVVHHVEEHLHHHHEPVSGTGSTEQIVHDQPPHQETPTVVGGGSERRPDGWVENPLQTGSTGFASGGGDITPGSPRLAHHLNPIAGEGESGGQPDSPTLASAGDPEGGDTTSH